MRIFLFSISFCFFLLGYGHDFPVFKKNEKSPKAITICKFALTTPQQITSEDPKIAVLDYTDIELEEEYHSTDESLDSTNHKSIIVKSNLWDNWYLAFSPSLEWNCYNNNNNFVSSFCLLSSPIYIANRVIRI